MRDWGQPHPIPAKAFVLADHQQHGDRHDRHDNENGRFRNRGPVVIVPRRGANQSNWSLLVQVLVVRAIGSFLGGCQF